MANKEKNSTNKDNHFTKFEIITIIFTIIATLVSIVSIYVSIQNAYSIADYQMNQQITFDKRSAAQQLLIEIESLNKTIQYYANAYYSGVDLSDNGTNINLNPHKNIVLIVTPESDFTINSIPFEVSYINNTIKSHQLPFKIYNTQDARTITVTLGGYPTDVKIAHCQVFPIAMPLKLYDDNGIYYISKRFFQI